MPAPELHDLRAGTSILLPPVWAQVFLPVARLVCCGLQGLGVPTKIVEYTEDVDTPWTIVVGWHVFRSPPLLPGDYVIYQLEPLVQPLWQARLQEKRQLFDQAATIWDYSPMNLPAFGRHDVVCVPLGYEPSMREVTLQPGPPDHDVLFYGFLSPRRRLVLERLINLCSVSTEPRWGTHLAPALARARIVLNIHQYDGPTPLEQARTSYVMNQHVLLVTEYSEDLLFPEIVAAPFDELTETVLQLLHDPTERRRRHRAALEAYMSVTMADRLQAALNQKSPKSSSPT